MWTKQQKWTDQVVELKEEVEIVTSLFPHVYDKERQELGLAGLTTSEHISSKLVGNLKKKEAEVQQDTEQVVKIFQYFQSKVAITEISD